MNAANLEGLVARGLSTTQGLMFVVDGGKGLGSAFREVFGKSVLVPSWKFLRWVATGLYRAEGAFGKLNKPESLAALAQALARHADAVRTSNGTLLC